MTSPWAEGVKLYEIHDGLKPKAGEKDEVIAYFSRLFRPWPHHTDRPTRVLNCGDTFVVEVTFTGTTPDGLDVSFDAVDVFDLQDGLIRRMSGRVCTNWRGGCCGRTGCDCGVNLDRRFRLTLQ